MANSIFLGLANSPQTISVNGITTTSTDGLVLQNTTPATSGVTVQQSPRLTFSGSAWNSVGAASETDNWIIEDRPVSVAGTTTSAIFFSRSIAGGAFTDQMNLNSAGSLTVAHKIVVTDNVSGEIQMSANGFIDWSGRAAFNSPADSQLNITNQAVTIGVGLDVGTDAVLKVRTRAQSGYATLDCLGLKSSGSAGASFGPGAVTSLTVVNGIVTAVS